jgi:hypothetical protein
VGHTDIIDCFVFLSSHGRWHKVSSTSLGKEDRQTNAPSTPTSIGLSSSRSASHLESSADAKSTTNVLVCTPSLPLPQALTIFHYHAQQAILMRDNKSRRKMNTLRTDIVYDGVELGLVSCGEEDIESSSSKLDRKLASDTVRCARDD